MKSKTSLPFVFAVGALVALGSPAGADQVAVFYSGGAGYNGSFSGPGTVYNATSGDPISNCTTVACTAAAANVGGDIITNSIVFNTTSNNPVQITASTSSPAVWFDRSPAFGGLGLQTASGAAGTGDDQIEASGILRLHFASQVTLTGVATLFADAHEDFGGGSPLTGSFLFCVGNSCPPTIPVTFSEANSANGTLGTLATGTDFAFAELLNVPGVITSGNVEFYVSALTYTTGTTNQQCTGNCPVPGPIVGAGLPGLLAGFGAMLAWYRKRRSVAA